MARGLAVPVTRLSGVERGVRFVHLSVLDPWTWPA